jgi:hypothetical protein
MVTSRPRLRAIVLGALSAVLVAVMAGLSACGSSAGPSQGSGDSCAAGTPSGYLAAARTAFVGVMLSGPAVGSVLASPARVRVVRYLKGSGPAEVTVITAVTRDGSGVVGNGEGITPHAGERWTIYTTSRAMPYQTSVCGGSALVRGS